MKRTGKQDKLDQLVVRAKKGDEKALVRAKELITLPQLWEITGDLAFHLIWKLVKDITGGDPIGREALHREIIRIREELAGPVPTELEQLLIDRVIVCWLEVHSTDMRYARRKDKLTPQQSEYFQRRQNHAQRRYLEAIRALAQMRRLLLPVVQVNIAQQQVNTVQSNGGNLPGTRGLGPGERQNLRSIKE